jgi:small subunit ribosomal protein S18
LADLTDPTKLNRMDYEKQLPRRFRAGDVYAPHDLSGVEMSKWKKTRRKPRVGSHGKDVLDMLGIDPRKEYKNFSMMAEYVTEMGRIKHRNDTGLGPKNQRRMAKAVRRAIGSGLLMPSVYKHPELLKRDMEMRGQRSR